MTNSEDKSGSCERISESEIDETLAESFPASDPPSWTLGVDPCPPEKEEDKETVTRQADE
jgi:hypothetical protein